MIEYRHIHKRFDAPVLTGVDLTVATGEMVAIVGPSGCGKSVLLKTTIGLIVPDRGDVLVDGESVFRAAPADLRRVLGKIGYVFQTAALFDSLNVYENVAMGIRPGSRMSGKQRLRDLVHRRIRSHGRPVVPRKAPAPVESTLCGRCEAVYRRKTWRSSSRRAAPALLGQAPRGLCPACVQIEEGGCRGRALLRGARVSAEPEAIRRRIANVAARARFTQPERRVVSVREDGEGLEVLTTSEKLAHRIVRELEKAFGGRAFYAWSHRERSLLAIWQSDSPDTAIDREGRAS